MSQAHNSLIKLVTKIEFGARICLKLLLVLSVFGLLTTSITILYLRWVMSLAWGMSLFPLYLIILPLVGLVFYWFALDGISRLPIALIESKETFKILQQRYLDRMGKKKVRGRGPIALTRRIMLLGGLLWDSRDVIDTASTLYSLIDLLNPIFWIFMLISLLSTLALSFFYGVFCGIHYAFF